MRLGYRSTGVQRVRLGFVPRSASWVCSASSCGHIPHSLATRLSIFGEQTSAPYPPAAEECDSCMNAVTQFISSYPPPPFSPTNPIVIQPLSCTKFAKLLQHWVGYGQVPLSTCLRSSVDLVIMASIQDAKYCTRFCCIHATFCQHVVKEWCTYTAPGEVSFLNVCRTGAISRWGRGC